jgi:hypothetical protein
MPNSVHNQSSSGEHLQSSAHIFTQHQQTAAPKTLLRSVRQDKGARNSDRTASSQPSQLKTYLRSKLLDTHSPQSQKRPNKKEPLQPLNLMVSPLVKAEVQRIAQRESIALGDTVSNSQVGAAYLEWAIHQDIYQQHEAQLFPILRKLLRAELRAFGNRIVFFLMRIAFAAEQARILTATILKRLLKVQGVPDEVYVSLVDQSNKMAR